MGNYALPHQMKARCSLSGFLCHRLTTPEFVLYQAFSISHVCVPEALHHYQNVHPHTHALTRRFLQNHRPWPCDSDLCVWPAWRFISLSASLWLEEYLGRCQCTNGGANQHSLLGYMCGKSWHSVYVPRKQLHVPPSRLRPSICSLYSTSMAI